MRNGEIECRKRLQLLERQLTSIMFSRIEICLECKKIRNVSFNPPPLPESGAAKRRGDPCQAPLIPHDPPNDTPYLFIKAFDFLFQFFTVLRCVIAIVFEVHRLLRVGASFDHGREWPCPRRQQQYQRRFLPYRATTNTSGIRTSNNGAYV